MYSIFCCGTWKNIEHDTCHEPIFIGTHMSRERLRSCSTWIHGPVVLSTPGSHLRLSKTGQSSRHTGDMQQNNNMDDMAASLNTGDRNYDVINIYEKLWYKTPLWGKQPLWKKYTTLVHTLHLTVTLLTNFIANYIISFFHEMLLDQNVLRIEVIAKWS